MGWMDSLRALTQSVDTEYDRRIRGASNIIRYGTGGHSAHHDTHTDEHTEHEGEEVSGHHVADERMQGEGGMLGHQQSNAGPQTEDGGAG